MTMAMPKAEAIAQALYEAEQVLAYPTTKTVQPWDQLHVEIRHAKTAAAKIVQILLDNAVGNVALDCPEPKVKPSKAPKLTVVKPQSDQMVIVEQRIKDISTIGRLGLEPRTQTIYAWDAGRRYGRTRG